MLHAQKHRISSFSLFIAQMAEATCFFAFYSNIKLRSFSRNVEDFIF